MRYIALLLTFCAVACDRSSVASTPVGVPPDAIFAVSAPTLGELRAMSEYVEPLTVPVGADEGLPAWFACERVACVLRRSAPAELSQHGTTWDVPDGDGSLVVWGAADRAALDRALARWRGGEPAAAGWAGFIEPRVLLERWKPTNPRAKELVERVTFQASRIDFTMKAVGDTLDAELRMRGTPGEPAFTKELGEPSGDSPLLAGLADEAMLATARLSADPHQIWGLLRGVLSAEQRGELDALLQTLATDYALDFEKQVVSAFSGHAAIFAYEADPKRTALSDIITLNATSEAVVLGVRDRVTLRRALGAWTQLSRGRFQVQTTSEDKQEWAWFEDDEIRWSAILGPDYLAIVDSAVALDHLRSWAKEPQPLPPALRKRGVATLLEQRNRSGLYLQLSALRATLPELFASVPPALDAVTITAEPDEHGELVRVRLTLR